MGERKKDEGIRKKGVTLRVMNMKQRLSSITRSVSPFFLIPYCSTPPRRPFGFYYRRSFLAPLESLFLIFATTSPDYPTRTVRVLSSLRTPPVVNPGVAFESLTFSPCHCTLPCSIRRLTSPRDLVILKPFW